MFVYRLVTDRTELGHICIVCTHVGLNGEHISSFQIVHWILKLWDIRPQARHYDFFLLELHEFLGHTYTTWFFSHPKHTMFP